MMKEFSKRLKGRIITIQDDSMKKEVSHICMKFPVLKGTKGFNDMLQKYQDNDFIEVELL